MKQSQISQTVKFTRHESYQDPKKYLQNIPRMEIRDFQFHIGCNIVIGRSMSGKSFLCNAILEKTHLKYESIILFTRNLQAKNDWSEFFKRLGRDIATPKESKISQIIKYLHEIQTKIPKHERPDILIIFDDIAGSLSDGKRLKSNKSFDWIANNSRHLNITSLYLIQDCTYISQPHLDNSFNIILFKNDNRIKTRQLVYKILMTTMYLFPHLKDKSDLRILRFYEQMMDNLQIYESFLVQRSTESDASANRSKLFRIKA